MQFFRSPVGFEGSVEFDGRFLQHLMRVLPDSATPRIYMPSRCRSFCIEVNS